MTPTTASHAPSRAVVDLSAYAANLEYVRKCVGPRVRLCPVIKADAYGHGLMPIAKKALQCDASMLAVATLPEAIALREAGIEAPVLLLFEPPSDGLELVVAHDLVVMLADAKTGERLAEIAAKQGKTAEVHISVDTGMNRQGMPLAIAREQIRALAALPHLRLQGIATHFPIADAEDNGFTADQITRFGQLIQSLESDGIRFGMIHAANSAGVINYPAGHFNMVRAGLMTYGVWPTADPPDTSLLKPVLRWETTITQVKELAPGDNISYGRTFTASERIRVATLPVGYADGYPFALGNKGEVLIHGQRCPVRGRVCMDQIVVEVAHVPQAVPGDTAVLLGHDGHLQIIAEDLAAKAGTIPYELLTGIGQRVRRYYSSA